MHTDPTHTKQYSVFHLTLYGTRLRPLRAAQGDVLRDADNVRQGRVRRSRRCSRSLLVSGVQDRATRTDLRVLRPAQDKITGWAMGVGGGGLDHGRCVTNVAFVHHRTMGTIFLPLHGHLYYKYHLEGIVTYLLVVLFLFAGDGVLIACAEGAMVGLPLTCSWILRALRGVFCSWNVVVSLDTLASCALRTFELR